MLSPTPELLLLSLLLKHEPYTKYFRYVKLQTDQREIQLLYQVLPRLHEREPGTDKSFADLAAMVWSCYPQMRQGEKDSITELLAQLSDLKVAESSAVELLMSMRKRALGRDLAYAALEFAEGKDNLTAVADLFAGLNDDKTAEWVEDPRNFVTEDLATLKSAVVTEGGLRWRLKCLNQALGPLRPGDFGFLFARPESGKTTFLASETTYMAEQAERPIIWFNNEEQGEKVRIRTFQGALGVTSDVLWADEAASQARYSDLTRGMLKIYDDATIHRRDVEAMVAHYQPQLILFDQIDKIQGFAADRPDLVLGRIYQWARELAKTARAAVIGICQADGTGEGVKWLTMAHVADAKTAKQAEADWILGIGKSNESGMDSVRYFNISKNKLLGDANTDSNLRHGRFEVWIKPDIARYEDLE